MHGPDVLIDTPEESKLQLNRSQVTRDRRRALLALASRPHRRPPRLGVAQLRLPLLAAPLRDDADLHPGAGLGRLRGELRPRRPVPVHGAPGDGARSCWSRESEPFEVGDTLVTPVPLDAENAHAFLFEGDGKRVLVAMDETHGWTPPDLGPLDLAVLPIGVFEHHPYTGERLIPEEFCKPPVKKTRYGRTLELVRALGAAARDALARRGDGPALARRARPARRVRRLGAGVRRPRRRCLTEVRRQRLGFGAQVAIYSTSEPTDLGRRRDRDHRPRRRRGGGACRRRSRARRRSPSTTRSPGSATRRTLPRALARRGDPGDADADAIAIRPTTTTSAEGSRP